MSRTRQQKQPDDTNAVRKTIVNAHTSIILRAGAGLVGIKIRGFGGKEKHVGKFKNTEDKVRPLEQNDLQKTKDF